MNRRKFLYAVGMTLPLAGCSGEENPQRTPTEPTSEPTTTPSPTTTEATTKEPEPASIKLVQYSVPEKVEINKKFSIKISVKNSGGQSTKFSAPLYIRTPDSSWSKEGTIDFGKVPSGETIVVTTNEFSFPYLNRYEIRLGQFSKTAVVQTVSSQFEWGTKYTTPEGYVIQVDEPELQESYKYEDYMGNIKEKSPENGGQWAFVNVMVKNNTGSVAYSPLASEFALTAGNSQYDYMILLNDPINKGQKFEGGELQPGIIREGWIPYAIPSKHTVSDLAVAWSQTYFAGDVSVRWVSSP